MNEVMSVTGTKNGFIYSFTAPTEVLKYHPDITLEFLKQHFDFFSTMAVADLNIEETPGMVEINKAMLDLKFRLSPEYKETFEDLMQEKEQSKPLRETFRNATEINNRKSPEQMRLDGEKLAIEVLEAIESFQNKTQISNREISFTLAAMSRYFQTKTTNQGGIR